MLIYGKNYRYHFHKFDKQLISEIYKGVCININSEDYDPDSEVLGEYYYSKLSGMYYRTDDKLHIDVLVAQRYPGQGFYNVHVSHMNIRTIEPMYYNSYSPNRHSMDYYIKLKNMKIKLGMIRVNNFKGVAEYNYEDIW